MAKQSLAQALALMEINLQERLIGFTSKKIRETSEEIKEEIDTEYNYFFQMIIDEVIGAVNTPAVLSSYTKWKPLSKAWIKRKQNYGTNLDGHYTGISSSSTTSRALGRKGAGGVSRVRANGTKPKGKQQVGSFATYIASLQQAGTTERFFGPVSLSYDFVAPSANLKISSVQGGGTVQRVTAQSIARKGKFVSFPTNLKMTVVIEAFTKLRGVAMNEWDVIDYIIKRIDPSHEKQWVKINGRSAFGRQGRPIRAVITPILKFYMGRRLPEIVKEAVKARGIK